MARHIMAVCVVCLLCADHLPCKQHDDDPLGSASPSTGTTIYHNTFRRIAEDSAALEKSQPTKRHTHDGHSHQHHHHGHGHDHDHDHDGEEEAERREKLDSFMQRIFKEFGDAATMTMDVGGFEAMVKRLNMYRLVTEELGGSGSKGSAPSVGGIGHEHGDEGECINSIDFVQRIAAPKPDVSLVPVGNLYHSSNSSSSSAATVNSSSSGIVSPSDKLSNKQSSSGSNGTNVTSPMSELDGKKASIRLDRDDLFNICPILLAQLASKTSRERAGCIDPVSVPDLRNFDVLLGGHGEGDGEDKIELMVWIYSTLAILGVSLCGLLGVAVIPCMDKHFYQHALQFLVALAIGTLCGDALLHLLPHAMMGAGSYNSHDDMMYKGLAAVCGIVFFYFMERFLTVIAEWYKHQEKKDKPSSRVRVLRDPESSSNHPATSGGSDKQCKHKYSSYPYCYDEIAMETKDDHHEHNHVGNHHDYNNHNNALAKCANHDDDHHSEYASLHGNGKPPALTPEDTQNTLQDNNTVSTNLDDASIESEQIHKPNAAKSNHRTPENYTIILREHETKHHGHSHTHGHVHSPPGSLSAVAWMVIMGDGLHNFTDGMTIGAAFANNIAGGFSTAIAVFCHELPHELGDFAVLLKAGMSARDAVYYNLLSSILSFVGMLIGIVIGHQPEASAWVFAVAAGLFLYIALVDMIPELTSAHGTEDRCKRSEFLLQFFGMSAGFGIMLLIAMYEHDLKEMFVD